MCSRPTEFQATRLCPNDESLANVPRDDVSFGQGPDEPRDVSFDEAGDEVSLDSTLARGLGELDAAELLRVDRPMTRRQGGVVEVDGRELVDFASNDYLGIAADPRPAAAAARLLAVEGAGAGAARLISGTHPMHLRLERALAAMKGQEAALLFASGYAANVGAIAALAGRGDILYSDELNHASVIDGCRLSRAEVRIFPHRDLSVLEELMRRDRKEQPEGSRWIVVEGVYSMEGDLFPLDRLVPLARRYGARTYLDDAHGTGVLGRAGRGSAEHFGVAGEIDVVLGTLGKAIGTSGAFVAGSERLRSWLLNRARSFVFSTAPSAALAAASLKALEIVECESLRRDRLRAHALRLRGGLAALGHPVARDSPGHIVPVRIGGAGETMRVAAALESRGYLVGSIRPPSVPPGSARLRIGLSATHNSEQIDGLLRALEESR